MPLPLEAVVIDGHTDFPSRLFHRPADPRHALDDGHIDLPRLRAGGVSAFVAALYAPSNLEPEAGAEHLFALHRGALPFLEAGGLQQVTTADEIRRLAADAGDPPAVGVMWAVENGRPLLLQGVLQAVADLGVRYVTATHLLSHEWCDAAGDDEIHRGLSDDGVKLVREMKRKGILVDVSHASDDAALHALDALRSPIIASHSSARALCDLPRNLSDSLARDIARYGGLVMANSYPAFVAQEAAEIYRARRALAVEVLRKSDDPAERDQRCQQIVEEHPLPAVPFARYVDHIVHWVNLLGEEHVGIGSDFDGISETLEGFEDVSRYPDLAQALLERGLGEPAVRAVLGESFLRVLEAAERAAG